MDLKQSVAVVTGAGSGIGKHLAIALSRAGARLALNDYNAELLRETEEEIIQGGGEAFSQAFDVGSRDDMLAFANAVHEHYGQVDVVVNNAGVALGQAKVEDVSYEDFQWIVNINMWGVIHGTLAFLPLLRERPRASLVNVCSSFGMLAVPEQAPYCATKFAVRGFTDSIRLELMDTRVRVSLVCPSQVRTNIIRNGRHKTEAAKADLVDKFDKYMSRISPQDAAGTILRGIRKGREQISVGTDAKIFSFASRFVPRCIIKATTRRELKKLAAMSASTE